MAVQIRSRYGYTSTPSPEDLREAIASMLRELRTERYEEPDNEHTRVAMTHNENVCIEIKVDGMVTLVDLRFLTTPADAIVPQEVYIADIPDDQMTALLVALAQGDYETVLAAGWGSKSELPPYKGDFYRMG